MPPEAEILEKPARPASDRQSLSDRIDSYASEIRKLHRAERRGDLAALRRMDPDQPMNAAFLNILVNVDPGESRLPQARRIALLVRILALPTDRQALDDRHRNLGRAAAEAGVSEARIQTLMTARGATFDDLLLRLARRLAKERRLPYADFGRLILGSEAGIEAARFSIARGYWAEKASREAQNQQDQNPTGDSTE